MATKTVYQTSITDHFFVFSELLATVNAKKSSLLFRDYKNLLRNDNLIKYNFHLRHQCSKIDWANIDVDEGFNKLTQCITISADKFVLQKPLLIKRKNWATNKLKRNKNQSRMCGEEVGLGLFPCEVEKWPFLTIFGLILTMFLTSQPYDFDAIAHIGL